ncbi:lytic transglycosylase domain-containing protein [Paraburkholderia sediminicola]|uniref:lytic transglycosylase domain-containing protein n=1 Tax=Paraburkholderia sediminicola TaxID=458836 RepID=UPI0038BB19C3
MSATSVLQIDIESAEFETFLKEFQKYQQALDSMPDELKAMGKKMNDVFSQGAKGVAKMGSEAKKQVKNVGLFEKAWDNVAKKTKAIEKTIGALGKGITTLLPGIGMAGLMAGGLLGLPAALFGAFTAIESFGSNGRTQNMAYGTSQGNRTSFVNNFGTYGLSESDLGNMESNKADYAKAGQLMMATGLTHEQAQGKDTTELVLDAINRIKDAQEKGNMAQARIISGAAGFDEGKLQNILQHSRQEINADIKNFRTEAKTVDINDKDLKGAQDFMRTLGGLGNQLKAGFFRLLTPLQGPITGLVNDLKKFMAAIASSGIMQKIIAKLSEGMAKLGDYINKPEFISDMRSVIKGIGEFATAIWHGIKFINHILHPFSSDDDDSNLTDEEKKKREKEKHDAAAASGKSGAWQGAATGAVAGAALGSVVPIVGTVAGGAIGAVVGGVAGLYEGAGRGKALYDATHPAPSGATSVNDGGKTYLAAGPNKFTALAGDSETTADSVTGIAGILARSIKQESGGYGKAESGAGAKGYLQWTDATAKDYGVKVGDIESEKAGWIKFYQHAMKTFHGDASASAAAYNWGPGNVIKAQKQYGADWLSHAPAETQHYVQVVVQNKTGGDISTGLAGATPMPNY